MNQGSTEIDTSNVTTRKRKSKMAATSTLTVTATNTSLIIDEILSQAEKEDVTKSLEEERKLEGKSDDDDCPTKASITKSKRPRSGIDKLLEDTSLDDLNVVLGRIGERFTSLDEALDEYQVSLEYSQQEIEDLKKENESLKNKIKKLETEDQRNKFHIRELDEKFERLDTTGRRKNLVFDGVPEAERGEKEDLQRIIYNIFDQMKINHAVECDTSYRTGPYIRSRPRPIVVTFLKQADRDHVFASRTHLKGSRDFSKVWVNEDLSPPTRRTKTMVRMIAKQAYDKGIPCKNNKYSVTLDDVRYNESDLRELPQPLSTQNVKQIQMDPKTIAYQSEHAPLSSLFPAPIKIGEQEYDNPEQALQHIKAKTHNRPLLAEKILLSRKAYDIKQMGDSINPAFML